MGLLRSLLTLPVRAPLDGAFWLAGQIHEAAERELTDPAMIRQRLIALEAALEAGEIDEAQFEAAEDVLLRRLHTALAR